MRAVSSSPAEATSAETENSSRGPYRSSSRPAIIWPKPNTSMLRVYANVMAPRSHPNSAASGFTRTPKEKRTPPSTTRMRKPPSRMIQP